MRGHIAKSGSSWTVYYDRPRDPVTGKRRKTTKRGFRTKKAAERWLAGLVTTLDRGEYVEPSKQTLAAFLAEWMPVLETRGLRPSTQRSYRMLVEKVLVPELGGIPLQRLAPEHLNRAYADLLAGRRQGGRGALSARSVRYAHTVLHRALADAVKWKRLTRNVAADADPPSKKAAEAKEMQTWSPEELGVFLEHVREDRLFAAYRLAAATGMRRGEVLGLPWEHVDLEAGRLAIRQTLIAPDYELQFSEPKTEKSKRSIPLDPETRAALRAHRDRQEMERLALGLDPRSELVFTQPDGEPVHPHQFSQAFAQRAKEAGVRRLTLHGLRHTWATLALEAGLNPKVVSEVLGHSSVAFSLDRYSHAIPTLNETAVALVAALIPGSAPAGSPEPTE